MIKTYIHKLPASQLYLSTGYLKQNALSNYIFGKGSESRATDGRVMVAPLDFCGSAACSFKKNAWFVLWNCNFFPVYTYNKQHTPLEINKLTNWHDEARTNVLVYIWMCVIIYINRFLLIYFRRNLNAYPLIVVDRNEVDGILNLCEVSPTRTRYTNGIRHFKWIGIIQFTIQSCGDIGRKQ